MVVHGRNKLARGALVAFLSSLGLRPIGWDEAVTETGSGSPNNLLAVRAALDAAQATVVLLTPDDEARLRPGLRTGDRSRESELLPQPRPNVLFEAGLALALMPEQTIFVEVGRVRIPTDLAGINVVQFGGSDARAALRARLMTAGCGIDEATTEYLNPQSAGNFDGAMQITGDPLVPDGGSGDASADAQEHVLPKWSDAERRRFEIFLDQRRTAGGFTLDELSGFLGGGYATDLLEASAARLVREGLVIENGSDGYRPS